MKRPTQICTGLAAVVLLFCSTPDRAFINVSQVGWEQHPGRQLPLQLGFQDETGRPVTLRDYFGRTPVVLVLAYFSCPQLCPEVLHGVAEVLGRTGLTPGRDYGLLAVSIDPRDTPQRSQDERMHLLSAPALRRQAHFLTTSTSAAGTLARSVGFRYVYDSEHGQFAHPAGFLVVTPGGQISRYFFGVRYDSSQLRAALGESASGHIGSFARQLLLLCYHFDPTQGRYSEAILLGLRVVVITALLGATLIGWRRLRLPGRRAAHNAATLKQTGPR